jgi:hypothetical protein
MISVGDIVYKKRTRGLLSDYQISKSSIGLVIKEHKDPGAVTQFFVQFNQNRPKWYYQHDLKKIHNIAG